MKKLISTILILTVALFMFTPCSFAEKDNGKGACIISNTDEPIQGLEFPFYDGFIQHVTVHAVGSELIVITPSARYNYHATLYEGVNGLDKGTIDAYAILESVDESGEKVQIPLTLFFEFESATLNEHFIIEPDFLPIDCENIPDNITPFDTNLFFKVKETTLIEIDPPLAPIDPVTFDLNLKLKHGDVQFVKFK